ncbi:hypothetical protein MRX96_041189 [Rhipicephalus microplus]
MHAIKRVSRFTPSTYTHARDRQAQEVRAALCKTYLVAALPSAWRTPIDEARNTAARLISKHSVVALCASVALPQDARARRVAALTATGEQSRFSHSSEKLARPARRAESFPYGRKHDEAAPPHRPREPALVNGPSLLHLNRHHWGGGEGGGRGQGRGKVARVARTASPPVAAEGEERSTDRSQWNAHVRRRRHLREDRQRPALVSLLRPVCVCTAHAPGPCSMGPVAATASTAFSGPARACRTRARREGALCVGEQRLHWDAGATSPARRATPGSGGLRKHHTSEPPSERLTNESRRLYE